MDRNIKELELLLSRVQVEKKCEVIPVKLQPSLVAFLKDHYGKGNVSTFIRNCVVKTLEKELEGL